MQAASHCRLTIAADAGLSSIERIYKNGCCCRLVAMRLKAVSSLEGLTRTQPGALSVKLPPALADAGRPAQWHPHHLLDAQLTWPMPVSDLLPQPACIIRSLHFRMHYA
jgi:hypothetical protein